MSQPRSDLEAWVALGLIPGLGEESIRKLLAAFGSPEAALAASPGSARAVVRDQAVKALVDGPDRAAVEATLRWLEQPGNRLVTLADPEYPRLLLEIPDPPPLIYAKGRVALLDAPAVAVVGSRNATPQGLADAEAFAEALSAAGLTVVSGLALGIDAAAHRGGLRGPGSTIAVTGTGLDLVYPARNRALAHQIARDGLLLSELPLATPAVGTNFPRRNRIISGLARGCLVVEAALRSGSLITAREALDQGRDVFAIPGSIHSPVAKGCHQLIKQGAKLVESAADILEELGLPAPPRKDDPAPDDDPLLAALGHDPVGMDLLCQRSGLAAEAVSARLLELELAGEVATLPGGRYQRVRRG